MSFNTLIFLAPLAGISDAAMRQVCLNAGRCLTFTEMVSVNGLHYKNRKTEELLHLCAGEDTVGVQLFGSDASRVSDTALMLEETMGPKIREININMGCPAPKIVKNGEGAALLKDPVLASKIISRTASRISLPVTVKFRKGFDICDNAAGLFARMCEDSGAERIYVHGRTREQYYSGYSDRNAVREAVESVTIPVIGNGDIFSADDAVSMLDETGCAGVMVARGALGNPFIIREINEILEHGRIMTHTSPEEKADAFMLQLRLAVEEKGEHLAIRQMRKHAAYYLKGTKHSASLRSRAVMASDVDEFSAIFDEYVRSAGI